MDRQARTRDTLLVKRREMAGRSKDAVVAGGRRSKDDRKQNTLAALGKKLIRERVEN
jgi:hypothetical protein